MIIIKLWGGLCNQMFQYAFGYRLAKEKNDTLAFDVDFYKKQPGYVSERRVEISGFDLSGFETVARPKSVKPFQLHSISLITRRLNFFRCSLPDNIYYVKEKRHTYTEAVPYKPGKTCYYDGYWQTEKYFCDCAEEIKKEFSFPEETTEKVKKWLALAHTTETVSVHIRRGDLAGKAYGYSDNEMIDYYRRAKSYIESIVETPVFAVFSDDISWCKKELFPSCENVVYQDNKWSASDDLCGISLCRHGIMSQSTFSWWGNWLGDSKDRIVVAPKGSSFNNAFIPERWKTI
jgi:hypothetical protein